MRMNRVQRRAAWKGLVCLKRGTKIPGGVLAKIPAKALAAASAAAGRPVEIFPDGTYRRLVDPVGT